MVAISRFERSLKKSSSLGSKFLAAGSLAILILLGCSNLFLFHPAPIDITAESTDTLQSDLQAVKSVLFDVNKVCPSSTKINSSNDHLPYPKLMALEEIYSVLKYWYEFNCSKLDTNQKKCSFHSIGQHLLHHAIVRNETLLTVQVGAMDGESNDPMFQMYAREGPKKHHHVGAQSFNDLRNWLPVMIEPVPANYAGLIETYTEKIAKTKGLGCAVPINAAVSYDSSQKTCPFCHTNTTEGVPKACSVLADWKKFQLGTLDCGYSKHYFKKNFDLCIIQDSLPCSTITNLLADRFLSSENIGMLQIDIEGYEYILLEGFINELPDHLLPPIIHFEHKVMHAQDQEYPLEEKGKQRLKSAEDLLTNKGYVLHKDREDCLAIKMNDMRASTDE